MTCKHCGEKVHYCSSCDTDAYMDNGYCSQKCFLDSDEYSTFSTKAERLWESLTVDQREDLWRLWHNGILEDPAYESMFAKLFIPPED